MKTLIVFDSVFGNTEKIAKAMGEALVPYGDIEVIRVTDMRYEKLKGVDNLIVGSPTRGFRPTMPIVNFLIKIPANAIKGVKVGAFDTRINSADVNSKVLNGFVKIFGYAAKPIADKLQKKGGKLIVSPEGFYVTNSEGPLKDGEIERAAEWAKTVIRG